MITLEMNGIRVEAENEKEAKKALAKLVREAKKQAAEREERRKLARLRSESVAYNVLSRQRDTEGQFPRAWVYYTNDHKYGRSLATPVLEETDIHGNVTAHMISSIDTEDRVQLNHYGSFLVGVVCNGSGFCMLVFLCDRDSRKLTCYAIGAEGDEVVLSPCPGIVPEMFRTAKQEHADMDAARKDAEATKQTAASA